MLDPSLRGFVEATDPAEVERLLAGLLEEQAVPLIRRILARKLRAHGGGGGDEELEDVVGDAVLALVSRLQSLRAEPLSEPIESFPDYTAVVAYNAFAYYLRRRHPERSRLKSRVRYVLGSDRRFGLWPAPDGLACGLTAWRGSPPSSAAGENLDRLIAEPERWLRWTRREPSRDDLASLLGSVLQAVGGPVELDRLVGAIAALSPTERAEESSPASMDSLPDESSLPADLALDQRRFTERLWREIGSLPVRQRVALLLNLRDARGAGLLWVFPLTGAASMRQIARALEMPDLELAEIWGRLPLDDRALAERLGCTRQQVINLRSAARKRLGHRLDERGGGSNIPPVSTSSGDEP